MATEIAAAYVSLYTRMPGVKGDITKSLGGSDVQGAVGKSGNKVGAKFMAGLGKAIKIGAVAAAAAVAVVGVAALKSAAGIQTSQKVLTGLYGSATDANRVMADLKAVSSETAIPYQNYLKGGEALSYLGVQADESAGIMKNLGLAVIGTGGTGQELDRATAALTKMSSQGKVTMESLTMLSESGVPIMSSLADHFGVSIEQVNKMASEGKIDIEQVTGAIEAGTGDIFQSIIKSGELAGGSFSNTWARVKDNVISSMGAMLVPLLEKLAPMLETAGEAVSGFLEQMESGEGAGGRFAGFLTGIWEALKNVFSFIKDNWTWLSTLAVAIGVVAVAVKVATAAQWLYNAAIVANPIGAIVAAIIALVAGLVYFFTQTELGQQIWQGFVGVLGAAWTWLWETILKPVFTAIGAIFTWLWESIIKPIVDLYVGYIKMWAAIFTWLWEVILMPIFNAIGAIFTWLWEVIIQPIVQIIVSIINLLAFTFTWLWENAVQPAFKAIGDIFNWIWTTIIKVVVDRIKLALKAMGVVVDWLYKNAIKPAMDNIGKVFNWLWENAIKPVIDFITPAIEVMGDAIGTVFGSIGGTIRGAFDGVVGFLKGVINSIIGVINGATGGINALIRGVNQAPGVNFPTIPAIPHLAQGALVSATRGGSAAIIGEGRYDEAVLPLGGPQLERIREALAPDKKVSGFGESVSTDLSDSTIKRLGREVADAVRQDVQMGVI